MDQCIGKADWMGSVVLLAAAAFAPIAAAGPGPWPDIAPAQTLEPTQQETFPGPSGTPPASLYFGAALAVAGDTALIGMPGYPGEEQGSGAADEGAVAIFVRRGGSWERAGTLRPNDPAQEDYFGEGVALLRDTAAVQAGSGIYLFHRTPSGWRQMQKLLPPAGARFDGGIALARGTLFAGSPTYGQPGTVAVFEAGADGAWRVIQTLASAEGENSDLFGGDVAAAGGTLVVGAAGAGAGRGAAFVFRRQGTSWVMQQRLVPADAEDGASFGAAVAISLGRIAIGAPNADYDSSTQCMPAGSGGAVYVFSPQQGAWQQQTKITTPVPHCTESFGAIVTTDPTHIAGVTPSFFPTQVGGAYLYGSGRAGDAPVGEASDSSLVSTPVARLAGGMLFLGLPFDRGFSTGTVEIFALPGR